jgi:hypothetical protein
MLTIKYSEILCMFRYTLSSENIMKTYFSVQCFLMYETAFFEGFQASLTSPSYEISIKMKMSIDYVLTRENPSTRKKSNPIVFFSNKKLK